MTTALATLDDLNMQLASLSKTADVYKVLYLAMLVECAELCRDVSYDASSKCVVMDGKRYPRDAIDLECPFTESGYIFLSKRTGDPYPLTTFPTTINNILKDTYGLTYRGIRKLVNSTRLVPLVTQISMFDTANWIPVPMTDIVCDPDIAAHLAGVAVYKMPTDMTYPFIPVYIEGANVSTQYPLYRFVAHLPYHRALDTTWSLPIVDHIHRDTYDSRRASLRYCTSSQNARNRCKRASRYHAVSKSNACMITTKTPEEQGSLFYIRTWCSLITLAHMDAFPAVDAKAPFQFITDEACHSNKLAGINPVHLAFLDKFIGDVLHILGSLSDYKEGYTCTDLRGHVNDGYRLLSELLASGCDGHDDALIKPRGACCADYVTAICHDIYKIYNHGEWAHMNLTRVPAPRHTLATLDIDVPNWDPVETLNAFELLFDPVYQTDVLQQEHGLSAEEAANKRRVFVWRSNADGQRVIVATFQDVGVCERGLGAQITLTELDSEYICHPWTKMPRNNAVVGDE